MQIHLSMFRKRRIITAVVVGLLALAPAIAVGRLYVGIPFVPPSGREIVASLSGLPIPVFTQSERAIDDCSGLFCMDYHGSGLVRLNSDPCAKAVAAAKAKGWRALPLPSNLTVVETEGAPPTPHEGFFLLEQPSSEEQTFAWIDTTTCRVYAELLLT